MSFFQTKRGVAKIGRKKVCGYMPQKGPHPRGVVIPQLHSRGPALAPSPRRDHGARRGSPSQRPAPTVSGGLQVDSRTLAAPARCSRAVPTASCLEGSPAASDSRVGRPLHRAATGRGGPARAECWTGRSAGTNGCRRRQASPIELLGPWHSPGWAWAGSAADLQLSPAVATPWPTQLESSICMGHQGRVGI